VPKIRIYLSVFRSSRDGYSSDGCRKAWGPLSTALRRREWPYDVGDDPSFFSSRKYKTPLTWGVCRPQIRNSIRPEDMCVFFAADQTGIDRFEYRLCAVSTVRTKVRQSDVWLDPDLKKFSRYLNLLIRPHKSGEWSHHEPGSEDDHKDWIWRIAEKRGLRPRGISGKHFKALERAKVFRENTTINGYPISIGQNYVIFFGDPEKTFILRHPPLIARCRKNRSAEKWIDDPVINRIKSLTLGTARIFGSKRKSLRTIHVQHAHPTIRWSMPPREAIKWRDEFVDFLRKNLPRH
jgi:hypothetical protein